MRFHFDGDGDGFNIHIEVDWQAATAMLKAALATVLVLTALLAALGRLSG